MAVFGLESTDIAFLGLLFGAMGALVTPLTVFLIRVGRDIAVIRTTIKNHADYIDKHNEDAQDDRRILYKLVSKVEVLETRITDSIFKRMDRLEASMQFLHQVMYGTKAHSLPNYMFGEDDPYKKQPIGMFRKTEDERPRCTICGENFETPEKLITHLKTHNEVLK